MDIWTLSSPINNLETSILWQLKMNALSKKKEKKTTLHNTNAQNVVEIVVMRAYHSKKKVVTTDALITQLICNDETHCQDCILR